MSSSKLIIPLASLLIIGLICGVAYTHSAKPSQFLTLIQAEEQEFKDFIALYSKSYTEKEYIKRFRIFSDNLAFIRLTNSQQGSIVLGINALADLSPSEFKSIYLRPKHLKTDPESEQFNAENLSLPTQVDWRTQGAVTPVKDQGNCGSCWAFSATGAIESAWILAGHSMVTLSEQQLMDCSRAYGNLACQGGDYYQAYGYVIANKGITSEANYPYLAKDSTCNKTKAAQYSASIRTRTQVSANNPNALEAAVAQQPTSVSVEADQSAWQLYKSGTVTSGCGTNLDHDVLAVGYNTVANPPYWIVKNSWGTSWGMSGYIQIAITSGPGVCGINMTPGFPTV